MVCAAFVAAKEVPAEHLSDRRALIDKMVASLKKERSAAKTLAHVSIYNSHVTVVADQDVQAHVLLKDFAFCGQSSQDKLCFALVYKSDGALRCCVLKCETQAMV